MPDVLWDAAKAKAAGEGRNISEVVRGLLADYAGMSAAEVEAMHGPKGADK